MRVLSLFLVSVLFLLLLPPLSSSASAPSGPPAELERTLESVHRALTDEAASPRAMESASFRLRHLPDGAKAPVSDLLDRLQAQIAPLTSPAAPSEKRQRWAEDALGTLDLLEQKTRSMEAASLPSGEPTLAALVPGNDDCANATALTTGTLTASTTEATNDGSASCGASATAPDVWYSYTAPADGLVTFSTLYGSEVDTVLSLHSTCPDTADDHELDCNDDAQGDLGSLLGRQMASGETVFLRVGGAGGATGTFRLTTDDREGGIRGRVTKEATGEPAQARIQIYDDQGSYVRGEDTELDGTYLMVSLWTGDFFVYAKSQSLISEVWDDVPCPFNCGMELMGTPVGVDGDLVEGIDFALAAGGSITGRVTDSDSGQTLFLHNHADVIGYDLNGARWDSTSPDHEGIYSLTGLPEGAVTVTANHFDYQGELWDDIDCGVNCDVTTGDPIIVTDGTTTEGIDFALDRLGAIRGSITSAVDGSSLGNFDVVAFDAAQPSHTYRGRAATGNYSIHGVPSGDYFVVTESSQHINEVYDDLPCLPTCPTLSGDPVTVVSPAHTTGIDFALDSRGSLSGGVIGVSNALTVNVNAYDGAGSKVASTPLNGLTGQWDLWLLPAAR